MKKKIYLFKTLILTAALAFGSGTLVQAADITVVVDDGSTNTATYTTYAAAIYDVNHIGSSGNFSAITLSSVTSVVITIPEGTFDVVTSGGYSVCGIFKINNVTIQGAGVGKTILKVTGGDLGVYFYASEGCVVQDLTIDANKIADTALHFYTEETAGSYDATVKNVTVKNAKKIALFVSSFAVDVTNLTVTGLESGATAIVVEDFSDNPNIASAGVTSPLALTIDDISNIQPNSDGAIIAAGTYPPTTNLNGISVAGTVIIPTTGGGFTYMPIAQYLAKPKYDFNLPEIIKLPYDGGKVTIEPGDLLDKDGNVVTTPTAYQYMIVVDGDTVGTGSNPVTPTYLSNTNSFDSIFAAQQGTRADFYAVTVYVIDDDAGSITYGEAIGLKELLVQVGDPKFVTADLFDFDPVGFDGVTLKDIRYDGNQHAVSASLKKGITEKEVGTILGYYYVFNGDYSKPYPATMDKDGLPYPSAIGTYELVVVIADNGTVYNGTSHADAKLVEINGKLYDFLILGKYLIYEENDYVPSVSRKITVYGADGIKTSWVQNGKTVSGPGYLMWPSSQPFTLTVTIADGYRADDFEVTTGIAEVDAGLAITKSANTITIIVDKVQKDLAFRFDGVSNAEAAEAIAATTVYGAAGAIYVSAPTASVVDVYSITGALAKTATVSGTATITLPAGIYIVKVGTTITKVIVK